MLASYKIGQELEPHLRVPEQEPQIYFAANHKMAKILIFEFYKGKENLFVLTFWPIISTEKLPVHSKKASLCQ
jgi:hypothetical protein